MAVHSSDSYMTGYAELAAYISVDPDLQIYRRFTRLCARNLLHMQSELSRLEAWFDNFDNEERLRLNTAGLDNGQISILQRNMNWTSFMSAAEAGQAEDATDEQMRQAMKLVKVKALQSLMETYRKLVAHRHQAVTVHR